MKILTLAAIALTLAATSSALADQPTTQTKTPPVDQSLVSPNTANQLDQSDLIQRLLAENPLPSPDKILERMTSAEDLLKNHDPGELTQETQHRISADLDILIEEAKKAEAQNQNTPQPLNGNPNEKPITSTPAKNPKPNAGNQAATNSTMNNTVADAAPGTPDPRNVTNEGWPNLPPRERAPITNAMKNDVLPEYKDTMQKFFDELAKTNRPH